MKSLTIHLQVTNTTYKYSVSATSPPPSYYLHSCSSEWGVGTYESETSFPGNLSKLYNEPLG